MSTRRGPGKRILFRDTVNLLGGWFLMIYQAQFAAHYNREVFLGGMVIAGVPGALNFLAALLRPGIAGPSSSSPESLSSAEPST